MVIVEGGGAEPPVRDVVIVEDAETPASHAARRRSRSLPGGVHPAGGLTVFETAAGAALTVGMQGLSLDDVAQFRLRARALLEARGLSLDNLSVNGEDRTGDTKFVGGVHSWR